MNQNYNIYRYEFNVMLNFKKSLSIVLLIIIINYDIWIVSSFKNPQS